MLTSLVIVSRQLDRSAADSRVSTPVRVTKSPVVHPLSVQTLTKCSSCNSFVLKTIYFDGGGVYGGVYPVCIPLYNRTLEPFNIPTCFQTIPFLFTFLRTLLHLREPGSRVPVLLFTDHCPLITAHFFPLQKDSSVSATQHRTSLVGRASESDDRSTVRNEARLSRVAVGRREPKQNIMGMLNRAELDNLERRELQLTILAAAFVLVQAAGLAMFMYPLVFLHPIGNKYTLRVAFFGFCALTLLFVGYLLDRQRTVRKLKEQILAELDRNVTLQHQASVDLLQSMPDQNHFWDRLTMEFRRAMTMQKTLSLLLVKAKSANASANNDGSSEAWSNAAKAMSRKLRPTDSLYRLSTDTFALVLPETDVLNAKRIAVRLQEELQGVRAKHNLAFDITAHNYPEHVKSSHELEEIVKSLLPAQDEWATPVPVEKV
jgi:diguanylate cyclase (GGDEF)-like protein